MRNKILLSWSGGKDSALALYDLKQKRDLGVVALLTTITADYDRISMHGVRRELLEAQARSIGVRLEKVCISKNCSNEEWEEKIRAALLSYKNNGVTAVAFGDIFLEDLKKYGNSSWRKLVYKGYSRSGNKKALLSRKNLST